MEWRFNFAVGLLAPVASLPGSARHETNHCFEETRLGPKSAAGCRLLGGVVSFREAFKGLWHIC